MLLNWLKTKEFSQSLLETYAQIRIRCRCWERAAEVLQSAGFDVVSILDLDPTMSDAEILSIAESDQRMVVTMDKDFGELVFHSGKKHNGVLLLRLEDADGEEKAAIVRAIIRDFVSEIEGKFCVFQNGRLRIR